MPGQELRWHDARDSAFERLEPAACWAIILNVRSGGLLAALTRGRHWLALRRIEGRWWNLDSCLSQPEAIGGGSGAGSLQQAAAAAGSPPACSSGSSSSAGEGGDRGDEESEAALKRFLQEQVQQRDAQVFTVADARLDCHPLAPDQSGT